MGLESSLRIECVFQCFDVSVLQFVTYIRLGEQTKNLFCLFAGGNGHWTNGRESKKLDRWREENIHPLTNTKSGPGRALAETTSFDGITIPGF